MSRRMSLVNGSGSSVRRRAAVVLGTVGAATTGVGIGLAAEHRLIGRERLRPDPEAREPFGRLPGRSRTVAAEDGAELYVEEIGAPDAPLTVVFCHGFCNDMRVWHYQRRDLAGPDRRLVCWDQRAHGHSGRGDRSRANIDQLGRDLDAVLHAVVPTGPIVLIGHSMGGMTIMALADQRPELFGDRVIGVGLVSTSTGKLAEITFGFPAVFSRVNRRVMPVVEQGLARRAEVIERSRRVGTDINFLLTRYFTFGSGDVSPAVVELVERMIVATPLSVITDFFPAFLSLDKLAAMSVLNPVEVVVLVGEKDALTPLEHSRAIAAALPHARLVVLPNSGHMLPVERPAEVTRELRELIERVESRLSTGDRAGSGA